MAMRPIQTLCWRPHQTCNPRPAADPTGRRRATSHGPAAATPFPPCVLFPMSEPFNSPLMSAATPCAAACLAGLRPLGRRLSALREHHRGGEPQQVAHVHRPAERDLVNLGGHSVGNGEGGRGTAWGTGGTAWGTGGTAWGTGGHSVGKGGGTGGAHGARTGLSSIDAVK